MAAPLGYSEFWNKVQKHWKSALAALEKEVTKVDPAVKPELEERLRFFPSADMAAMVAPDLSRELEPCIWKMRGIH
jgi:hypothetical protein